MSPFILGLTLDTAGKVLLGITVLLVHRHVSKERRIDADVPRVLKQEQSLGVLGIVLIVIGSLLQALYH